MNLDEQFKKSVIVFISFIILLGVIVFIRIKVNVPQIKEKQQKKVFQYKEQKDLNLTELETGKRLFYEQLNQSK